jgi:hypothetical protein
MYYRYFLIYIGALITDGSIIMLALLATFWVASLFRGPAEHHHVVMPPVITDVVTTNRN